MDITQRVAEAIRVVTGDFEFMYDCECERGSAAKEPVKANVLYVGHDEYYELASDRLHSMPDAQHGVLFMGLRVLRVNLASWLQVAHVDGAK